MACVAEPYSRSCNGEGWPRLGAKSQAFGFRELIEGARDPYCRRNVERHGHYFGGWNVRAEGTQGMRQRSEVPERAAPSEEGPVQTGKTCIEVVAQAVMQVAGGRFSSSSYRYELLGSLDQDEVAKIQLHVSGQRCSHGRVDESGQTVYAVFDNRHLPRGRGAWRANSRHLFVRACKLTHFKDVRKRGWRVYGRRKGEGCPDSFSLVCIISSATQHAWPAFGANPSQDVAGTLLATRGLDL